MTAMPGVPRVLHVLSSLARGGAETNACRLIPALAARGFEQCVVSLTSQVDPALAAALPVALHLPRAGLPFPASARFLAGIVDRFRPDVIHGRAYRTWLDCVTAAAGTSGTVRVVQSFHGSTSFELDHLRRKAAACLMEPHTTFVAVSHGLADQIRRHWRISPERVRVIHNGIDTERFAPPRQRADGKQALGIAPDCFVVGSVGSLRPVKNHALLIDAFARFRQRHGPSVLLLVGDGPLLSALQQRAAGLGLAAAVRFCGRQPDVVRYLAAMDVFVQPSLKEGSPTAVLEAMACGVAALAVASSGCRELHARTGLPRLVGAADCGALVEALESLAADDPCRLKMGADGRAQVQRGFGFEGMVEAYASVYDALAGRPATCGAGVG